MIKIKLTQGFFTTIDDEDYELVSKYKWSLTKNGSKMYARTSIGGRKNPIKIYMHRLILGLTDPALTGDHINGDGLNNQRNNLRACTKKQNNQNVSPRITKRHSKYVGVSKRIKTGKWRAYIKPDEKQRCKTFNCETAAALWYNCKAREYFGEFAYQNFIRA